MNKDVFRYIFHDFSTEDIVEDPMDARSNLRDYIKYHFDIEDDEEINNYIACVEVIAEGVEWRKLINE